MGTVILKGFPKQVSEYIELPDMAELMLYPYFFAIDAEDVYKHGNDFHRHLLSKTPITNKRKHVKVLSQVRILTEHQRSCTSVFGAPENEWHIDSEITAMDETRLGHKRFDVEDDIVHLLTSEVTSPTEFLTDEIDTGIPDDRTLLQFLKTICREQNSGTLNLNPKAMPHNQIVSFTNHLHRATPSKHIEFKYMWRVAETDGGGPLEAYDTLPPSSLVTKIYDEDAKGYIPHMERTQGKIIISLPSISKDQFKKYPLT